MKFKHLVDKNQYITEWDNTIYILNNWNIYARTKYIDEDLP